MSEQLSGGREPEAPVFSVVMPTFNRAEELPRAIGSVLCQEFQAFELIVIDDGSTDSTADCLSRISDDRLRVVHQENSGASSARNHGVAVSTARYVTFLDSDDEAHPHWLATFAALLANVDVDFASVGAEVLSPTGERTVRTPSSGGPAFGDHEALFLCGTFALKRSLFLEVGGYADGLAYSENTDLRLRLAHVMEANAGHVVASDVVCVRIYLRDDRYDPARRYDSAVALLRRNEVRLGLEPRLLATYEAIAGVSASRIGNDRLALGHLLRAVRRNPRELRHTARLARALVRAGASNVRRPAGKRWRR